jgi:DHA2 family multidrug resistance protein
MLVFTMILISALEIIDATIVSIALPMMQSSLSANSEEIGWTVTAYLIATSIVLPLTGFIVTHLGRRNTLIVCTVGFGVTSMLCGFSVSLTMMILFRTLQGLFGALFAPLAQAILADHFPKASLNHAMSWYGMGIVVIPLFGPLLGSYLTEYLSWRWIFYMNVPICLLALSLIAVVISDNEQTSKTTPSVDWIGLLLMAICIGTAQFVLEQGNNLDWLNSKLIQVMLVGSALAVIVFMLRGFCLGKKNIIDFAIFLGVRL